MRGKFLHTLIVGAALASVVLLPLLAYREAQREAYTADAELALTYAHDVLHRTDETGRQTLAGILRLKHSGHAYCSEEALALMREIDLTSTYIQAIGQVRDGVMVCSSLGMAPIPMGVEAFHTSAGVKIYLDVPVGIRKRSAVMGVERDGFIALIHRDLPLDTWSTVTGVSVAVYHLERPSTAPPAIARGYVSRDWLRRLAQRQEVTFMDGQHLVAIARSAHFPTVAIAAVPLSSHRARTQAIAMRLVPAGVLAGLAAAVAILLLARQQMSVAAALRHALRQNEFFLDYQPLVDLRTGRWVGAEALLRMRRGTGELIGPELFIPIAEQNGLIVRLTERVFRLVKEDAGTFLEANPDFHIAINIAAADLRADTLLPTINRFLDGCNAKPSNLIIEITERAFIDPEVARRAIAQLRARGIAIAIDDFGTGYSSLSHLESLDLDLLKIDRTFVETIGTDAPTSQVVGHIIAMARTIGLHMIAEGIETEEQAAFVREHGVEFAQGWLYGRPMSFEALKQHFDSQFVADRGREISVTDTR